MNATRNPPPPVEALIRSETIDERLTMMAIQIDHTMHTVEHTMHVVEALAALLHIVLGADLDGWLDGPGTAAKGAHDRLAAALGGVA